MRRGFRGTTLLVLLALAACQDTLPTATDVDQVPVEATTVEVRIPFSDFARDVQVFGGFGLAAELVSGVLAQDFEGTVDARTLVRFGGYPLSFQARDTTGTTRTENEPVWSAGRVVVHLDTLASVYGGPVTFSAGSIETPWHPPTATWTLAADTLGVQEPWPIPGAGPVTPLGTVVWDPSEGADSVILQVDSATVAALGDTARADEQGVRVSVETAGVMLKVTNVRLWIDAVPSFNPDTVVTREIAERYLTFIYDPPPPDPAGDLRVGGVPAWRTFFRFELPTSVQASPEVCAEVGCPIALDPERINFAGLVLETRASPPGYQPADTVRIEVREVPAPDRLPKAPLGGVRPRDPFFLGNRIPPSYFGADSGRLVTIRLTDYIEDLLREPNPDNPVYTTVALLSRFEPSSLGFATFGGSGGEQEPYLRIILTIGEEVGLP